MKPEVLSPRREPLLSFHLSSLSPYPISSHLGPWLDALSDQPKGIKTGLSLKAPQGKVLEQVEGGVGKTDFLEFLGRLNPSAAPL